MLQLAFNKLSSDLMVTLFLSSKLCFKWALTLNILSMTCGPRCPLPSSHQGLSKPHQEWGSSPWACVVDGAPSLSIPFHERYSIHWEGTFKSEWKLVTEKAAPQLLPHKGRSVTRTWLSWSWDLKEMLVHGNAIKLKLSARQLFTV